MHDNASDGLISRFTGKPGQLYVTEAMKSETRLPDLFTFALKRIEIVVARRSQIGGIDCSIRVERLRMANANCCPCRTINLQANPSHHVLSKVDDPAWVDHILDKLNALGP